MRFLFFVIMLLCLFSRLVFSYELINSSDHDYWYALEKRPSEVILLSSQSRVALGLGDSVLVRKDNDGIQPPILTRESSSFYTIGYSYDEPMPVNTVHGDDENYVTFYDQSIIKDEFTEVRVETVTDRITRENKDIVRFGLVLEGEPWGNATKSIISSAIPTETDF